MCSPGFVLVWSDLVLQQQVIAVVQHVPRIRFFNQVFALFLSPSSTFVPGVPGYENTYWPLGE